MSGNKIESSQKSLPKIPGRVHEHLKRIRGEDNKISSISEAEEMLQYLPRATVVWSDNPNDIPFAYMEANDYIKKHKKKYKRKRISKQYKLVSKRYRNNKWSR